MHLVVSLSLIKIMNGKGSKKNRYLNRDTVAETILGNVMILIDQCKPNYVVCN